jgi:hypothetical protein
VTERRVGQTWWICCANLLGVVDIFQRGDLNSTAGGRTFIRSGSAEEHHVSRVDSDRFQRVSVGGR